MEHMDTKTLASLVSLVGNKHKAGEEISSTEKAVLELNNMVHDAYQYAREAREAAKEPIGGQGFQLSVPRQFLGIIKGIVGEQGDDLMLASPMIRGYTVHCEDEDSVTIKLYLSDAEQPVDWCTPENLAFKQTVGDGPAFDFKFLPGIKDSLDGDGA